MASDRRGKRWPVSRVWIHAEGFLADLYVDLEHEGALDAELRHDAVFLGAVFGQLKEQAGYDGPGFESAESGMQTETMVVLEPNAEFDAFAQTKGFKLLT